MNKPFFGMGTNAPGARLFSTREELEDFTVLTANQIADLLAVITESDADDGFIKSALLLVTDMSFQVQQATAALRDGPARWQDELDWFSPNNLAAAGDNVTAARPKKAVAA